MTEHDSTKKEFYLGVGGEQTGPFSQEVILEGITNKSITAEALIWKEGFESWEKISSVPEFREAFHAQEQTFTGEVNLQTQNESAEETPEQLSPTKNDASSNKLSSFADSTIPEPTSPKQKQQANNAPKQDEESSTKLTSEVPTFAPGDEPAQPIFQKKEGQFGGSELVKYRTHIVLGTLGTVAIIATGALFFAAKSSNPPIDLAHVRKVNKSAKKISIREIRARKLVSQLPLSPTKTIEKITKFIAEKPADQFSKEVAGAAADYYRRMRRPDKVGDMLSLANRHAEAANFYLDKDYPAYNKAIIALTKAFEGADDDNEKYDLLIKQIETLLGPLSNQAAGIEKINLLDKTFPDRHHQFAYYMKSADQKIVSLFNRMSFYFVQDFTFHMENEFPQLNLVGRPFIELQKLNGDHYRIVGSYKGEITLNRDRMDKIFLIFWLVNEKWHLVETNLTKDRAKWAATEKERLSTEIMPPGMVFSYLEQLFKTQFPDRALHETVTERDLASKGKK